MTSSVKRGWHFLQIPGPSNTPNRVLQAIAQPTIDHRGPAFGELTLDLLPKLQNVFQTTGSVVVYPSSGTGAWEAALVNLFQPGDKILAYETGHFSNLWKNLAEKIGLKVKTIASDWRRGVEAHRIKEALAADDTHEIKAVMVVHNETSTGVTSNLEAVRKAIDEVQHPALLLVDVVSSLGTTPFYQDKWGIDVAIAASQKGFMLPPGLGFNSINDKALKIAQQNQALNSYWQWDRIIEMNEKGYYPYTPASNLLFGLQEALNMILEEGLPTLFNRHAKLAKATRMAAKVWGLENQCLVENEFSDSTTALIVPGGKADELRKIVLDQFNMSLGTGLGQLKGKVFRIGHLGDFNELMLCATLSGVEMGLQIAGIPHQKGGVQAAMDFLTES
ncbi:MAG: aminotransferase class V-fold PLP-dependent enzyme [Cyclobacteriaceae bacterium]